MSSADYNRLRVTNTFTLASTCTTTDASTRTVTGNQTLTDSVSQIFGTGSDLSMRWDGTDFDILAAADDSIIKLGTGTNSFDVWLFGNTANEYISWDASANDLKFEDSCSLMFGTGAGAGPGNAGDVELRWDGTDLDLLAAANNSIFKIGNGTNSFDVWIMGATANGYISWDASANDLKFEDSCSLMFGTGAGAGPGNAGDVEIRWDGTDLDVLPAADDSIIKFGNGTLSFDIWAYGNTSSDYVLWDASANKLSLAGSAYLSDINTIRNRTVFLDDFLVDTLNSDAWATDLDTGTAAVGASGLGGTLVMTTAAGDNNHVEAATELVFSTSKAAIVEARLHIDDITTAAINFGLSSAKSAGATNMAFGIGAGDAAVTDAQVTDFCGFVFDTDADTDGWFGAIEYGAGPSTELEGAGATAPANGTYQTLRIEIDASRNATFYINGSAYGSTTTGALDATTAMCAYLAVCNRAAVITRVLTVDYVYVESAR